MPAYTQRIILVKEVEIHAINAEDANNQLRDLIQDAEFASGFDDEGHHEFYDEPVTCPSCKGDGCVTPGEYIDICAQCGGEGTIPFES